MSLSKEESLEQIPQSPSNERFRTFVADHGEAILTALSALLILAAWGAERSGAAAFAVPLYAAGFIAGGYMSARDGLRTLIHERAFDVDLLMVVAAIGAASIGYWVDGAILILIFALSGTLEGYALKRTSRDITSLMHVNPETATQLVDDSERIVRASSLVPGDVVLVKAGERIPADGRILEGFSAVDQASITGESIPVEKGPGSEVFAGTINGQGILQVEVTQAAEASLLARLIRLVQEAQSEKPATQLFLERFERQYAKVVIVGALVVGTLPPYVLGWSWQDTIYRAMIFLVVASPCALVASMMPAILSAISNGTRHGVLFKSGVHLETMGDLKVVAFDKTGTITQGVPVVTDVVSFAPSKYDEHDVLTYAASLESFSEHPLARSITRAATDRSIELLRPEDVQEKPGFGVSGYMLGSHFRIGRPNWVSDEVSPLTSSMQIAIERLQDEGKTVAVLAANDDCLGLIGLQDTVRPQARRVVAQLRALGIEKVVLLTGDTERSARSIAKEADCDEVYAELLPEDKVRYIKLLSEKYGKVAMVGDGMNDAPALATASVGIAMGGAGTDVALETSDVVLVSDDLSKVPYAITLGRRVKRIVTQNITFALTVIGVLILTNFLERLTLPLGVVGHEGSTILVILNGLRLLWGGPRDEGSNEGGPGALRSNEPQ